MIQKYYQKKLNQKKKKKNQKKAKTQTNIRFDDKTKFKKKKKKDKDNKSQRGRARTTVNKSKSTKPPKRSKSTKAPKQRKNKSSKKKEKKNDIELNTISYQPSSPKPKKVESKPKKKAFPWASWAVDNDDNDEKDESSGHRVRRSSLGSIREIHNARAKKARIKNKVVPPRNNRNNQTVIIKDDEVDEINYGHSSLSGKKGGGWKKKKSSKKKRKKSSKDNDESYDNVDIYDPQAMKKKRRKEKEKRQFKVVPKHHVKRSSLPTYQSIRKNNPQLNFFVKKENKRNLASLLDQPEKRKKSKHLKNLSRSGFELHVNHRYRLEDGRVGVCKFRGRTEFGKSSEDWIGLVIQIGEGENDGSVQGRTYFRCRMGKGLFVRPYDIIQDMGSQNKMLTKQDIKLAKQHIKRYKKMSGVGTATSSTALTTEDKAINADHGDMTYEKFYNPKTLLDKNKGKKAAKKKHHTQV